jgi:hypothetical protein
MTEERLVEMETRAWLKWKPGLRTRISLLKS